MISVTKSMNLAQQLLDIKEVATIVNVEPQTIRNWSKTGKFPAPLMMAGGKKPRLRWRPEDIEHFLQMLPRKVIKTTRPPFQPLTTAELSATTEQTATEFQQRFAVEK